MDDTQRRKAMNEAVFRRVNERIEELHQHFALTEREPLELVCECDRADCTERIQVALPVYERVRGDAASFFVAPGHEDPAVEDIVDASGNYLIVRKRPGEPQRIATATDPRS